MGGRGKVITKMKVGFQRASLTLPLPLSANLGALSGPGGWQLAQVALISLMHARLVTHKMAMAGTSCLSQMAQAPSPGAARPPATTGK